VSDPVISAILFLAVGVVLCAAAVIAIFATVEVYYLSGSRAIAEDGLRRGSHAPRWSLADSSGQLVHSPPRARPVQLIVFSDHSLKSFPSVAEGLRALATGAPSPEIVVLTRQGSEIAAPVLAILGLGSVPVLTGSPALYGKYNVRVMPFVVAVDAAGLVRASSLVNHAWQIEKLWRLAQIPLEPGERRTERHWWRRPAGVGV
jgi:hypothetical protein